MVTPPERMTPLESVIRRHITQAGPMSLHDYMGLCLGHPLHGYYMTREPFGTSGDFTTAPEVSQMFGELLGLSLAQAWLDQGAASRFVLAELGPGRGRLMADIMRVGSAVPGFVDAAEIYLVETSPAMRAEQAKLVPSAQWVEQVEDLPDGPLFLIANEFFDALPVRQFHRKNGGWFETVVGLDDDVLTLGLRQSGLPLGDGPEGAVREQCPSTGPIIAATSARIGAQGGAAIIVDYGYGEALPEGADTVQAVRNHAYVDILATPGEVDLTAHVDFGAIAGAVVGAQCSALIPQGELLARLGIGDRALALAAKGDPSRIEADLRRLTDPAEMGSLFKALAIYPPGAQPPAGFDPR